MCVRFKSRNLLQLIRNEGEAPQVIAAILVTSHYSDSSVCGNALVGSKPRSLFLFMWQIMSEYKHPLTFLLSDGTAQEMIGDSTNDEWLEILRATNYM